MSSQKSNTRIEISVKLDKTIPTLKSSKVPSKAYLDNDNRVLCKYVLKPRSIVTCNLTQKAAKIPHVKLESDSICYQIFALKHSQTAITCQDT